jgi:hypothetical protein
LEGIPTVEDYRDFEIIVAGFMKSHCLYGYPSSLCNWYLEWKESEDGKLQEL